MAELNIKDLENVSGGAYTGPCFRYTIQRGDCLSVLAQRFHTTQAILMELNPQIKNPDLIYAGNVLLVPYIGDIVYV